MFNINGWELVIIAVLVLLVVGPDRLPEFMYRAGRLLGQVRRMADEATADLTREMRAAAQQAEAQLTAPPGRADPAAPKAEPDPGDGIGAPDPGLADLPRIAPPAPPFPPLVESETAPEPGGAKPPTSPAGPPAEDADGL